ncbi:MAG TPA: ABC transporter permease [Gaiellaceae bacterium]|nr:ABC transporter permease [Gaiellaceae bacterium]
MTASFAYTRFEFRRVLRSRRFLFLALGFPVALYFAIAGPNRHVHDVGSTGLSLPLYYMVGLAAFGTMNAMMSTGARIASERAVGWNRQLRITPLSTRDYFRAKVATGYMMALLTLAALYLAGGALGVSIPAGDWARMTIYLLIGLIPFAAIGILLGHLLTPDSIGPALGGSTAFFAFLGGSWFPITSGALHDIAQVLPSYWLVQAAHIGVGGGGWGARGWIVVVAWTVVVAALARRAYRRDTKRV